MARIPRVMVDAGWLREAVTNAQVDGMSAGVSPEFSGEQVHRLTNVLRLTEGAVVEVFAEEVAAAYRGVLTPVVAAGAHGGWHLNRLVEVAVVGSMGGVGDGAGGVTDGVIPITVACGWPRARRADFLIEKLVELGVAELAPLVYTRSARGESFGEAKLGRYRRLIAKACEQSRRNRPMDLLAPVSVADFLTGAARVGLTAGARGFVATAASDAAAVPIATAVGPGLGLGVGGRAAVQGTVATILMIGPEGGLTAEEIAAARAAGFQAVSLGALTLRVETAAVAAAAVIGAMGR